jgi:hypothetical protein
MKARACPHCGACEKSGWSEDGSDVDGLDLPDDDFDYEKFKEAEFGTPRKLHGKALLWKITATAILILMIIAFALNFLFR